MDTLVVFHWGSILGLSNFVIYGEVSDTSVQTYTHLNLALTSISSMFMGHVIIEVISRSIYCSDLLQVDNLIMGGDLNFSVGYSESWGHHAQIESLSTFFENILENHSLIDISSVRIQLTWRNRRTGDDKLARRLDRFLIKERLLRTGYNYR